MNRELKFRAWHKTDNIMWFPSLMDVNGGGALYSYEGDWVPHYPSKCKLMQYTWLKDKNWVEIYEGDIIVNRYTWWPKKWEIHYKYEVKRWIYNLWANWFEYDYTIIWPYVECEYMYNEMIEWNTEIIGNIYENPKLLESK